MKVFILESWDEFGVHDINGVYSTKEKAEVEKEKLKKALDTDGFVDVDDYIFQINERTVE